MDSDFGFGGNSSADNSATADNENVTNIDNGKIENAGSNNGAEAIDDNGAVDDTSNNNDDNKEPDNKEKDNTDDKEVVDNTSNLVEGTTIEVDGKTYTVDKDGNIVNENGSIYKEKSEVAKWLEEFENVENDNNENFNINSLQDAIGVEIVDENDKPIIFNNNLEGVKDYVNAVIESSKAEHYEEAISTLYNKYPIIEDVLNYYIANGNSLKGYGEMPDRSGIEVDEDNEAQQELIIRTAWEEQNRKGDVDGYIQYLKSAGTLYATAQEELNGLKEIDAQHKEELETKAKEIEEAKQEELKSYWTNVHNTIKTKKLGEYQIPDTIVRIIDGHKISATPDDFFNYVYQVDKNGRSRYEYDLLAETPQSRMNDELLRAYLKFVGGNYSNLVDMAINKKDVEKLRLRAKSRNANTVRISKPNNNTTKGKDIDLGY